MCPQANAQYMYLSIKYVYKIDAFLTQIFFNKGIRYTLKNLPCPSFAAGFESRIIGLSSWSVCFTGECGVGILSDGEGLMEIFGRNMVSCSWLFECVELVYW